MKKKLLVFPVISGMILVCVMLFFQLGININTKLNGSTINTEKPELNFRNVLNGSYQKQYEDWFSENFPMRGYILKTYNQIRYSLFNATNAEVVIGKADYLFEKDYIYSYCKIDRTSTYEIYNEYAKNLKVIQNELEKRGKNFFYIISPSKVEYYKEYIPEKFKHISEANRKLSDHELLVEVLNENDIHYFDTSYTIEKIINEKKYAPFFKTGIHWNLYSAAEALTDIFVTMNKQLNDNLFPLPNISVKEQKQPATSVDTDVFDLLNLWFGKKDDIYYNVNINYRNNKIKSNAFLFSTSFGNQLMTIIESDTGVFENFIRYNYLQRKEQTINGHRVITELDRDISNTGIEDILESNNYIFIESNASGIQLPHFEFVKYVRDYYEGNLIKNKMTFTEKNANVSLVVKNKSISANKSDKIDVPIKIVNNSDVTMSSNYKDPIYISYHIFDINGNEIIYDGIRTKLPNDILPGESVEMKANIDVPKTSGNYIVGISIVQEGIMWLEYYNPNYPVRINLTVQGGH